MKASIPYRLLKALPKMPYSTDRARGNLCAIHFQPDQRDPAKSALAVATDGHSMAVIRFPGVVSEPGCITADDALRLAKLCDLSVKDADVRRCFPVEINELTANVITKARAINLRLDPYDGEFPNFRAVMPKPDELKPCNARFDARLIAHACHLFAAFAPARAAPEFHAHGALNDQAPAVFSLGNSEPGYDVYYLIMPMRYTCSVAEMTEDYGSLRDAAGAKTTPPSAPSS